MNISIKIYDDELWWGGSVKDGYKMPISKTSNYILDCTINRTFNQFNGLFVSTKGRYIYFDGGAVVSAKDGTLSIANTIGEIDYKEGFNSLKDAYLNASNKHFNKQKNVFDSKFVKPIYCTWLEMLLSLTEDKILNYASSIVDNGFERSCLIIDDGWMRNYGDWDFDEGKFKSPKTMIDKLHNLGFSVMLWIVPFVNDCAPDYQLLKENDAFLKDKNGDVLFVKWWNGESALLDLTSQFAYNWIKNRLQHLKEKYSVDCFKLDAGDAMYYEEQEKDGSSNYQSELWARLAIEFPGSELRACVGLGGELVMQRLADKKSDWSNDGLSSLISSVIQAGLIGYPYVCADMVGGGQISDKEKLESADFEFYVRSCQVSALFPINQYSNSIWNKNDVLKKEVNKYINLRKKYELYISQLLIEASKTFEPIVRPIIYNFPLYKGNNTESFMLGDKYLVAPVTEKGSTKKKILLPDETRWIYNNEILEGGQEIEVRADLDVLPIFERIY